MAVTRQVMRGSLEQFIAERGGPISTDELLAILDSVPDVPPVPGDELPADYAEPHLDLKSPPAA